MNFSTNFKWMISAFIILGASLTVANAQTGYQRAIYFNKNMQTYDMVSVEDSNVVVVGEFQSPYKGAQAMVSRLNSAGQPMWATLFGGSNDDIAVSVELVGSYLYVLAETRSYGSAPSTDADFQLVQMDLNGNVLQSTAYGGDYDEAPKQIMYSAIDTSLVLVGGTSSYLVSNHSNMAVWVVKVRLDGTRLWARAFGGNNGTDFANSLAITEQGKIVLAGTYSSFGAGGTDAFTAEVAKNGQLISNVKTFGYRKGDVGLDIIMSDSLNYIVSGNIRHPFNINVRDPFYIKVHNYTTTYHKLSGLSGQEGRSVIGWRGIDTTDYYLGGWTKSTILGKMDYYIARVDTGLNSIKWFKTYDKQNFDGNAYSMMVDNDGVHLTGSSNQRSTSYQDIYQVKTGFLGYACDSNISVSIDTIVNDPAYTMVNQDTTTSIYHVDTANFHKTFSSISYCSVSNKRNSSPTVTNPAVEDNFSLYPNPSKGLINLNNIPEWAENIYVFDLTGKQVHNDRITSTYMSIDFSSLPEGIYQITINGGTQMKTVRFVKE